MNLDQLKKNVGYRVQLDPPAIHLDDMGRELPLKNEDWIVESVTDAELRISEATVMGLATKLGKDSVHHFTSDASRSIAGGIQYGFLTLTLQLYIQNGTITYRPCRPGERVPPPPITHAQKWVDFKYPKDSGLQDRLEMAGYRVAWSRDSRLARLVELEGWEIVVEKDGQGMPTSFHLRDNPENQVFIKSREPDLKALAKNPFWRTQPGLMSCTVDTSINALVFRFTDPVSAATFLMRMERGKSSVRCVPAPGRVDTVLGYLT